MPILIPVPAGLCGRCRRPYAPPPGEIALCPECRANLGRWTTTPADDDRIDLDAQEGE